MAVALDLLSPTDKPALAAVTKPELQSACQSALASLGYKVHVPENHSDFSLRFAQTQYQVVLIEHGFGNGDPAANLSLQQLQVMPMSQRRHTVIVLLGDSFQTLHPMQAFQQSVHAVIHPSDLANLTQIVHKTISDNDLFLSTYRDAQQRLSQAK